MIFKTLHFNFNIFRNGNTALCSKTEMYFGFKTD